MKKQIKEAINRSISHTENVTIRVPNLWDAFREIDSQWEEICEESGKAEADIDRAVLDYEGEDTLDVWGWHSGTPENEQEFRLTVRLKV